MFARRSVHSDRPVEGFRSKLALLLCAASWAAASECGDVLEVACGRQCRVGDAQCTFICACVCIALPLARDALTLRVSSVHFSQLRPLPRMTGPRECAGHNQQTLHLAGCDNVSLPAASLFTQPARL